MNTLKKFVSSKLQYDGLLTSCAAATALMGMILLAVPAAAQHVVRVEEDWELVLNTPDAETGAPQISLQMTPSTDSPWIGLFLINFRDVPDFESGGVQVQLWQNDVNQGENGLASGVLDLPGETVTFTLYMDCHVPGKIQYGVKKGHGLTWGDLGDDNLNVTCTDPSVSLVGYDADYSVKHAQLLLGEPRVQSLKLLRVRKVFSNGQVVTEDGANVFPNSD